MVPSPEPSLKCIRCSGYGRHKENSMENFQLKRLRYPLLGLVMLWGCVQDDDFKAPTPYCSTDLVSNIGYGELRDLYKGETVRITADLIIEGYVVSSDRKGNFFGTLHFQDRPVGPTGGFQMEVDLRDSHLLYPIGAKILIKLKGLYLGNSKGIFKIGGQFTSFGNISVGRLPVAVIDQHLFVSCNKPVAIEPVSLSMDILADNHINTLVQFYGVEIKEGEIGLPFAKAQEETLRTLRDCSGRELKMLNSGYSDFQGELLPKFNGSIVGVLQRDGQEFRLVIRDSGDMDFEGERCTEPVDEFTSGKFFISELADPDNDVSARFVELYNSDSQPLSLEGWILKRYTNANTVPSSTIDLSGFVVGAGRTFVISPNAQGFESVYGFVPDMAVGTNGPADSNGDDNLQLVDPFGTVIDSFGIVGEDGSGTDHEFEDGRAIRNPDILMGNPEYDFNEWTLYNDTGGAGTINRPQNAPNDYTPGIR